MTSITPNTLQNRSTDLSYKAYLDKCIFYEQHATTIKITAVAGIILWSIGSVLALIGSCLLPPSIILGLQVGGLLISLISAIAYIHLSPDFPMNSDDSNNYGLELLLGKEGVSQNLACARFLFKRAADQGHAKAQFNYACMLYLGEGGAQDLHTARDYFKRAADQGHAPAQHDYALMLYLGEGGAKDLPTARDYFQRAAGQGHAPAQRFYAVMLYYGAGGGKDLGAARDYFKRAADQGHAPAQHSYALMLYFGEGGEKDRLSALRYLDRAYNIHKQKNENDPMRIKVRPSYIQILHASQDASDQTRAQADYREMFQAIMRQSGKTCPMPLPIVDGWRIDTTKIHSDLSYTPPTVKQLRDFLQGLDITQQRFESLCEQPPAMEIATRFWRYLNPDLADDTVLETGALQFFLAVRFIFSLPSEHQREAIATLLSFFEHYMTGQLEGLNIYCRHVVPPELGAQLPQAFTSKTQAPQLIEVVKTTALFWLGSAEFVIAFAKQIGLNSRVLNVHDGLFIRTLLLSLIGLAGVPLTVDESVGVIDDRRLLLFTSRLSDVVDCFGKEFFTPAHLIAALQNKINQDKRSIDALLESIEPIENEIRDLRDTLKQLQAKKEKIDQAVSLVDKEPQDPLAFATWRKGLSESEACLYVNAKSNLEAFKKDKKCLIDEIKEAEERREALVQRLTLQEKTIAEGTGRLRALGWSSEVPDAQGILAVHGFLVPA